MKTPLIMPIYPISLTMDRKQQPQWKDDEKPTRHLWNIWVFDRWESWVSNLLDKIPTLSMVNILEDTRETRLAMNQQEWIQYYTSIK